jgi:dihydrofolate reductase
VLTHNPPETAVPGATFVTDLDSGVAAAQAAAGDKYVNVLGASVALQCIDAGVLDEVFVCIAPVMLGDGVPLFHRPGGGARVRLERISVGEAPLDAGGSLTGRLRPAQRPRCGARHP